jgi:hypothetical protein
VPAEEGGERLGHRARLLELEEMARAGKDGPLGLRQPRQEQAVRLAEARMESQALLPEHDERRLRDPPNVRLAELRCEPAWEVDLEAGRRVRHGLLERAWNDAVEVLAVRRPAAPEELVDGDARADVAVPRDRLLEPAAALSPTSSPASSSVSVPTSSGASSASCSATSAPNEWPTTCARSTPACDRTARQSAACSSSVIDAGAGSLPP